MLTRRCLHDDIYLYGTEIPIHVHWKFQYNIEITTEKDIHYQQTDNYELINTSTVSLVN